MEVSRNFPTGPEKPLDTERLTELVRLAIKHTFEELMKFELPSAVQGVCRPKGEGIEYVEIPAPKYLHEKVWTHFHAIRYSTDTKALTDYLWDHGALKNTFSGPNPTRDAWEQYAYFQIVVDPLRTVLSKTARERLVDHGVAEPWAIDQDILEQSIQEVVDLYGKHRQILTAFCPLGGIKLSSGDSELGPGLWLREWTTRDVAIFLCRHSDEFLWDDFKQPAINRNIAEVSIPLKYGQGVDSENWKKLVQDQLDLLKWSLLIAKDQEYPSTEGTCVLTFSLDRRGGRFRREGDEYIKAGQYSIDGSDIQKSRALIQQYCSARSTLKKPDDLQQALWHFGRACVAFLSRDVLLESIMGLDALLVPGGGEAKYRFCLHGATLLSNIGLDGEESYQTLKKLYELRSQAAHGRVSSEIEKFAPKSRKILALTLKVIVDFLISELLNPQKEIPVEVQNYVLRKAVSR